MNSPLLDALLSPAPNSPLVSSPFFAVDYLDPLSGAFDYDSAVDAFLSNNLVSSVSTSNPNNVSLLTPQITPDRLSRYSLHQQQQQQSGPAGCPFPSCVNLIFPSRAELKAHTLEKHREQLVDLVGATAKARNSRNRSRSVISDTASMRSGELDDDLWGDRVAGADLSAGSTSGFPSQTMDFGLDGNQGS
ncbi:hypothetical protein BC830DRAFT_1083783 [Chytriomyces sp. MP71]|nr:hypothetical protein BC830DRAFT_1083783 [Chytriomyces sp. MP71]